MLFKIGQTANHGFDRPLLLRDGDRPQEMVARWNPFHPPRELAG